MRLKSFFFVVVVMLLALTETLSAQTGRMLGARRLVLDDGTTAPAGQVYLSDVGGSLGVDLNGVPGLVNGFNFPSTCALLDLSSVTKGFLTPRMSNAQELGICAGTPPEGLIVYNLTNHTLDVFNGSAWGPVSGWQLRGNSITLGSTALGGSYIGTNTAQDFVTASNGVERTRLMGVAGPTQGFFGIGTASPNRLLEVAGVSGTPSARFGSLGGAALVAPPLVITDGIVMANNAGDINKYNTAFVVGSFGWLRTGNTIIDGNNILGTLNDFPIDIRQNNATVMTVGTVAQGSNVGIKAAPTTNWALTVGTVAAGPNNGTLNQGNEQVNGTFTSAGNSTVATNAGTTNTFGNNGASTNNIGNGANATNNIGNGGGGAAFNNIGTSATLNQFGTGSTANTFGNGSTTNSFGVNATTNNVGTAGTSTNTILGSTNINTSGNDQTTIGSLTNISPVTIRSNAAGSSIVLDVANTANNLRLNNINQGTLATDINFLVMTSPTSGNVRWRTLGNFITGSQGVEVTYVGGVADAHFSPSNAIVPFTSDRFINTAGFILHVTNSTLADYVTFNGANNAVNINNATSGATNIGNGGGTNIFGNNAAANTFGNMTAGGVFTNTIGNITGGGGILTNNIGLSTGGGGIINNNFGNVTGGGGINNNTFGQLTGGGVVNNAIGSTGLVTNTILGATNINATGGNTTQIATTNPATTNIGVLGGTNTIAGTTTINNNVNNNTSINTGTSTGSVAIGNSLAGPITVQSNAPTAISLNVTNVANNLQLANIAAGSSADAAFLDLTSLVTGNVRTRTIGSFITGTNGVEVTYVGSSADAHFGPLNTSVPFTTDRFINAAGFILHITNNALADIATFNGANNAIGINDLTVGNTRIGNGGGTTANVIGNGATSNRFGENATAINWFGSNTPQNVIGQSQNAVNVSNFLGEGLSTGNVTNIIGRRFGAGTVTNNIGDVGATVNNIGTTASTNTVLGATNINVTGGQTTQIATTTAAITNIGVLNGTNTIAGNTTINNNVNNTTGINTGTSTGAVTIGNNVNTGGISEVSNAQVGGATGYAIQLDVTNVANNLKLLNIANDATPLSMLSLNASNQVRTTPLSGLALEGIVYSAGAFRLGSGVGDAVNPFLQNRKVSVAGFTLNINDLATGLGNNFVSFNGTGDVIGLANTAIGTVNMGFVGGTNTINGITNINTTTYNLTQVGNLSALHQLNVRGVQDATGIEALASNVWDLAVTGDIGASGMIKSGASLLVDGVSATRRLISDLALTISTDLAGAATGGDLTVRTTSPAGQLLLNTTGGGNIQLASTGGNGSLSISTVGTGNVSMFTNGSGSIAVGPTGSGQVTIQENAGHPVTVTSQNGALSVTTTGAGNASFGTSGTGAVAIQGTSSPLTISTTTGSILHTTTSGNVTFSSTSGNVQIGPNTTIGGLTAPVATLDIRGSVNVSVVTDALAAPRNVTATDYMIIGTNAAVGVVNLPATVAGRVIIVKSRGAGNITVNPPGATTIDGVAGPYTILGGGNLVRSFVGDNAGNWIISAN